MSHIFVLAAANRFYQKRETPESVKLILINHFTTFTNYSLILTAAMRFYSAEGALSASKEIRTSSLKEGVYPGRITALEDPTAHRPIDWECAWRKKNRELKNGNKRKKEKEMRGGGEAHEKTEKA